MLLGLFLTALFGLVWGAAWGALDAILDIKGFLSNGDQITSLFRNIIAMLVSMLVVSFIFGMGNDLISMIIAIVTSIYIRPYVYKHWRW